jgi:antitoxin component YwqK of YwqJK toxin-antitoxin module
MPREYTEKDAAGRVRERCFRDEEGRLAGESTTHDESGKVLQRAHWREGKLHGPFIQYGPGGEVEQRAMFVAGRLEGPTRFYDARGRTLGELSFREGQLHGELAIHEDGQLLVKQSFAEGRPEGLLEIHEAGRLVRRALFHKGKRLGKPLEVGPDTPEEETPPAVPPAPERESKSRRWLDGWLRGGSDS